MCNNYNNKASSVKHIGTEEFSFSFLKAFLVCVWMELPASEHCSQESIVQHVKVLIILLVPALKSCFLFLSWKRLYKGVSWHVSKDPNTVEKNTKNYN